MLTNRSEVRLELLRLSIEDYFGDYKDQVSVGAGY